MILSVVNLREEIVLLGQRPSGWDGLDSLLQKNKEWPDGLYRAQKRRKMVWFRTRHQGVNLTIEKGEFVVFVGPSGCGKSTLLRMIAGLEETSRGQIIVDDRDATAEPPYQRGLAMVFQSYALYPHMSVRDNMGFSLKSAGLPKKGG